MKKLIGLLMLMCANLFAAGASSYHYVVTDGTNVVWLGTGVTNPVVSGDVYKTNYNEFTSSNKFNLGASEINIGCGTYPSTVLEVAGESYFIQTAKDGRVTIAGGSRPFEIIRGSDNDYAAFIYDDGQADYIALLGSNYAFEVVGNRPALLPHNATNETEIVNFRTMTNVTEVISNLAREARSMSIAQVMSNGAIMAQTLNANSNYIERVGLLNFTNDPSRIDNAKEGDLWYDRGTGTLNHRGFYSDSTLQIGMEAWVEIINKTGTTLTNGTAVYVSGGVGGVGTDIRVDRAYIDGDRPERCIGLVTTTQIQDNATGIVTMYGIVNGLDTSAWTNGTDLYLSSTAGMLVNTQTEVYVGTVKRQQANTGQIWVNPVHSAFHDTDVFTAQGAAHWNPQGFPDVETYSGVWTQQFVDSSRTFSNILNAASGSYFWHGHKKTFTTSQAFTITTNVGTHFLYYNDASGTIRESYTPWGFTNDVQIATIYWTGDKGFLGYEMHGSGMSLQTHELIHSAFGSQYEWGLGLTTNSISGFSLQAGAWHDEDIEYELPISTSCVIVYQTNATHFTWSTNRNVNFLTTAVSTNEILYNNGSVTSVVPAGEYVAYWLCAVGNKQVPLVSIMGQRTDTTLAAADANNTFTSMNLGGFPAQELKPLYRFIYRRAAGTGVLSYQRGDDYRVYALRVLASTSVSETDPVAQTRTITVDGTTGTLNSNLVFTGGALLAGTNVFTATNTFTADLYANSNLNIGGVVSQSLANATNTFNSAVNVNGSPVWGNTIQQLSSGGNTFSIYSKTGTVYGTLLGMGLNAALNSGGNIYNIATNRNAFTTHYNNRNGASDLSFVHVASNTFSSTVLMFLNGTNGNVGVNTSLPAQKLHVAGNILATNLQVDGVITSTASGSSLFSGTMGIGGTVAPLASLSVAGKTEIGFTNASTLSLHTTSGLKVNGAGASTVDSNAVFRLDGRISHGLDFSCLTGSPYTWWIQSRAINTPGTTYPLALNPQGGSVGIGTNAPNASANLHLKSASGSYAVLAMENSNGGAGAKLLDFLNNGNSFSMRLLSDAYGTANTAYQLARSTTNIDYHAWNTGAGVERMRIVSGGNVGIGTSTPTNILSVVGPLNAYNPSDSAWDLNGYDRLANIQANNAFFGSEAGLLLGSSITGSMAGVFGKFWGTDYNDGRLGLATALNSNLTVKMTITGAGNVGIGTPAPLAKLEVNAGELPAGATNSIIRLIGGYNANAYTVPSIDYIHSTISKTNAAIRFPLSNGGNDVDIAFCNATASGLSEKMRIMGSGNVGIGTTAPATLLQVGNNDTQQTIRVTGKTGANSPPVVSLNRSGSAEWSLSTSGANIGDFSIALNAANYLDASIASAAKFTILNANGNVGIGTTAPGQLLSINSSGTGANSLIEFKQGNVIQSYVGMGTDNNMYINNQTARPILLYGGNVGVGKVPTQTLDVNGGITASGTVTGQNFVATGTYSGNGSGLTNLPVMIPCNAYNAGSGAIAAAQYGSLASYVAFSDTDAFLMGSFWVRQGGEYDLFMLWGPESAQTAGKSMGMSAFVGTTAQSAMPALYGWNILNGSAKSFAIPALGNVIGLTTNLITSLTVADNTFVAVNMAKTDNAGGATGNLEIYGYYLRRK